MDKPEAIVLVRDEWGVYIGFALGFGFWSLIDPAGQPAVVTFVDEDSAIKHVQSWEDNNDPSLYKFVPVKPSMVGYATIDDLKRAGLSHLLGDMEEDAARFSATDGSA